MCASAWVSLNQTCPRLPVLCRVRRSSNQPLRGLMQPLSVKTQARLPPCSSVWGFVAACCPVCCCPRALPHLQAPLQFFVPVTALRECLPAQDGIDIDTRLPRTDDHSALILRSLPRSWRIAIRYKRRSPSLKPCKILPADLRGFPLLSTGRSEAALSSKGFSGGTGSGTPHHGSSSVQLSHLSNAFRCESLLPSYFWPTCATRPWPELPTYACVSVPHWAHCRNTLRGCCTGRRVVALLTRVGDRDTKIAGTHCAV